MSAALIITLTIIALVALACRHWRCILGVLAAIVALDVAGGFVLYHAMPLIGFLVLLYFLGHPPH